MAWIKVKTAVVIGVGLLVVAGTTVATVKVIQNSRSDALWDNGIHTFKNPAKCATHRKNYSHKISKPGIAIII